MVVRYEVKIYKPVFKRLQSCIPPAAMWVHMARGITDVCAVAQKKSHSLSVAGPSGQIQ